MPAKFKLTPKQEQASRLFASDARHVFLFGGARCVAGETVLDGHDKTIAELADIGEPVVVITSHGRQLVEAPFCKGSTALLRFQLSNGMSVEVTDDHRFWTGLSWTRADSIHVGDVVSVCRPEFVDGLPASNWEPVQKSFNDTLSKNGYSLSRITGLTGTAVKNFYTLHVPQCEHYLANGIWHHNSGKTILIMRQIVGRALAHKSRHLVLRFRFSHVKASIIQQTLPEMMDMCYPGIMKKCHMNKSDWIFELGNGSQIWFGGLDEKDRTEKILGQDYVSIFLNECSQIPWASRNMSIPRLAQKTPMRLKMFYDANPPSEGHWTYKLFIAKRSPDSRLPLANPDNYAAFGPMNPVDNADNLPASALEEMQSLSARMKQRFWSGEWGSVTESALWTLESIEQSRFDGSREMPEMRRIVVAIDPSGNTGDELTRSDEVGIVVVGLGVDGKGYVLEDVSGHYAPNTWGRMAVSAFDRHAADCIVGEVNFGGAMVGDIIRTASREGGAQRAVPFKAVRATRGKVVRAEPIAALFEQQKVVMAGVFPVLEEQLCGMTPAGYVGDRSPDRADAMIWGLAHLFPGLTRREEPSWKGSPTVTLAYQESKRSFIPRVITRRG